MTQAALADRPVRKSVAVTTVAELAEIVAAVQEQGEFCFDVESRGFIQRSGEVLEHIEREWVEKEATLKTTNASVRQRSRQAIEDRWTSSLALDTLRNEVFWIGIAIAGRSWAIPMGHPNGEVLIPEERGDGSTVPPEGYRKLLNSGKESKAKNPYLVPAVFTDPPEQLTQEQVFGALETIFMDPDIPKIGHNIKFDTKSVAKYYNGELPKGLYIDTQVLQHVLDENLMNYRLTTVTSTQFQGYDPYHKYGKIGKTVTTEPFDKVTEYVHLDARWTWMLYKRLMRRIEVHPPLLHATNIDLNVLAVLAQMEMNGINVAERQLKTLGKDLELELNNILLELMQYAPIGFNPDANSDKQQLLFAGKRQGGLGLKIVKRTAGGQPSVDKSVLLKLQGKHPVVDLILKWQEYKKMKSTYVDGMRPKLHAGKLHPQFHLHRTDTGRLSSSDPNLQNIPRDGKVRSLFVAGPGDELLVADYDQIELRVMCMFSKDPAMSSIFIDGTQDIHTATAAKVTAQAYEDVDDETRQVSGKMPNFLIGYGGGAKLLAEKAEIPLDRAEEVIANYQKSFSRLFEWKSEVIAKARHNGYATTAGGRRRRLSKGFNDPDKYIQFRAERQAVNAVVQGTASEICKEAMVDVADLLDYPACKMLVQVHDELVVSVPADETQKWLPVLENGMGNGKVLMGIPLRVSGHSALSWYDAKGK